MADALAYPFVPASNSMVLPGQYWSIPLSDGRYACVRILALPGPGSPGARTQLLAGLLDWVDMEPPTSETIAGAPVREVGMVHVRAVKASGGAILGIRPLSADGLIAPAEVHHWWGIDYAQGRAEHLYVAGDPPPPHELRDVASPLTEEMLAPFESPAGTVQFASLLSDRDFARLGEWLAPQPNIGLRAYGSHITDLEFLRHFPGLRRFSADAAYHSLESLEGLTHLPPDLEELGIGGTKRRLDLTPLGRFAELRSLYLEGQTRNIEVVSGLTSLEELTLRSITLPDLDLLRPLRGLRAIDLKLGGSKNLDALPDIGTLEYVALWMVKGLSDLGAVGELPSLRYLFLQALRQVSALPDLRRATALRRVHLETMKGLRDLTPLAAAPALEELLLLDMSHLAIADLECLVGHPTLKAVTPRIGGRRRQDAAEAHLGLPSVESEGVYWRDVA